MSKCRDNVCLFRNSRHSYAFDFSKCDIDRYFEQEYVRSRGRGQVCGYTRVAIYTCTHYVYLHVNSWRRRATGAPTPAPATAPGAAAWTGDTGSSSRGCSASSAGHSHTQSYHVDNNNYKPVFGDQIVNSDPAISNQCNCCCTALFLGTRYVATYCNKHFEPVLVCCGFFLTVR